MGLVPPRPVPARAQWAPAKLCGSRYGALCSLLLCSSSSGGRKDILAELSKSQKVFSEKLDHLPAAAWPRPRMPFTPR